MSDKALQVEFSQYQKADRVTKIDRFFAATFLRLIPAWVTPNHLTIFRFLTIPFIILLLVSEMYVWGMALFVISALSDALDGALARTKDKITDWGKMFDPLADKVLISVVAAFLIVIYIGFYIALGIILIEVMLILSAYYKKAFENKVVQASTIGKLKMILQSVGIGFLFLYAIFPTIFILVIIAEYLLYTAIVFALVSLLVYKSI